MQLMQLMRGSVSKCGVYIYIYKTCIILSDSFHFIIRVILTILINIIKLAYHLIAHHHDDEH